MEGSWELFNHPWMPLQPPWNPQKVPKGIPESPWGSLDCPSVVPGVAPGDASRSLGNP